METVKNHSLYDKWVLWAHLPHDTNWSLKSYKKINRFEYVEDVLDLYNILPDKLIKNCMFFLMKDGIGPTWEDKHNCKGGCFSFKIETNIIADIWREVSFLLLGSTLSSDEDMLNHINGITISPKKNFCIIKIWLSSCDYQDPTVVTNISELTSEGCLFKKHNPEF